MVFVEKICWDHFFVGAIPTHHAVRSPAFVGHIDGHYACESEFDWAIERFAVSEVVMQIGMVQVLVFAAGLFVLSEDFAVGIFGDPAFVVEEQGSFVAADQVVHSNAIAHGSQDVNGHASGVLADHFDIVG